MESSQLAILLVLIGVAVLALAFKGGGKSKPKPPPFLASKSGWWIEHSPGMPAQPRATKIGFSLDVPPGPDSHVHIVVNYSPPVFEAGDTIRLGYSLTGSGFTPDGQKDSPALVCLYFLTKGDLYNPSSRWCSNKANVLVAGDGSLSAKMVASDWVNAEGKHDPVAFAAALADLAAYGLAFGHETGRAHGVFATTPGRFELLTLTIIK